MSTRGELARARSPNSDFPARAPDSTQGRRHDQHVESAPRVLFASAPRFPQSEASGYVCPSTSCGFSCASSLRGGCSTGASHQSRSRSLTPVRPNARPISHRTLGPDRETPIGCAGLSAPTPRLPRRYPSLRRNGAQLRCCGWRNRRSLSRSPRRLSLVVSQARCGVRSLANRGCNRRKRAANQQVRTATHLDRMRSSGGFLRS